MDSLKQYLLNHPQDLKEWLAKFPWENFESEMVVQANTIEKFVIAKHVTLEIDAEVSGLLICQEAEIQEGAEIQGTMLCETGRLDRNAECNYLIGCTVTIGEDAEIRSAMISDSLELKGGAEVDELETLDSTKIEIHEQNLIKKSLKLPADDFVAAVDQRLRIILETAISLLKSGD